jgi:hypothetical protein
VANWIDGFYNRVRRHSFCEKRAPVEYDLILAARAATEVDAA